MGPGAGRLRERVTVRRLVETDNGKGGFTDAWSDVATVRAQVIGLDGRESVMDQVLQGVSVFKLWIRWRRDLLQADQLRPRQGSCFGLDPAGNPRDVNIRSIVDPFGTREWLVIMADTASTR